jgi:hypothetical protein
MFSQTRSIGRHRGRTRFDNYTLDKSRHPYHLAVNSPVPLKNLSFDETRDFFSGIVLVSFDAF